MTGATRRVARRTTEDYFTAAFELLGADGSDGLTIAALCERLGVTKGSFYHHFGGLPEFVDQLLAWWEDEYGTQVIARSAAEPEVSLRARGLVELGVSLPHAAEAALRAWGRSNDEVATVVGRMDKQRERHVENTLVRLGLDRSRARLHTRMALDILIGRQMRERRVNRARLRQHFDELVRAVFLEAGVPFEG
jgi:AcrR family transcriptional regulator